MTTIAERIEALPPRDADMIRGYIDFLLEKRANPPKPSREMAAERSKAYNADFANRMAAMQAALKLTDKAAALAWGVTVPTYRRYLAGGTVRPNRGAFAFAERYSVPLDYLIAGDGPMFDDRPSLPHLGENVLLFQSRSAVQS